jgi:hypothetical protein
MIQVGQWSGYYSFLDKEITKIRGFEKTYFDIQILTVNDNTFTGKVQDDLSSGGTEGIGEINGKIQGDRIDFVKTMPIMTVIIDKKGTKKTSNRKHRPIFYTGFFSSEDNTVTGTWRFKFGFVWLGIVPVPVRPSKGVWSMTLKK